MSEETPESSLVLHDADYSASLDLRVTISEAEGDSPTPVLSGSASDPRSDRISACKGSSPNLTPDLQSPSLSMSKDLIAKIFKKPTMEDSPTSSPRSARSFSTIVSTFSKPSTVGSTVSSSAVSTIRSGSQSVGSISDAQFEEKPVDWGKIKVKRGYRLAKPYPKWSRTRSTVYSSKEDKSVFKSWAIVGRIQSAMSSEKRPSVAEEMTQVRRRASLSMLPELKSKDSRSSSSSSESTMQSLAVSHTSSLDPSTISSDKKMADSVEVKDESEDELESVDISGAAMYVTLRPPNYHCS